MMRRRRAKESSKPFKCHGQTSIKSKKNRIIRRVGLGVQPRKGCWLWMDVEVEEGFSARKGMRLQYEGPTYYGRGSKLIPARFSPTVTVFCRDARKSAGEWRAPFDVCDLGRRHR